jgi:transposase
MLPPLMGTERWRDPADQPPAGLLFVSPIFVVARAGPMGGLGWVGYKVHLTETCEEETPNIIMHVETTAATATDEAALAPIHTALRERELLPAEHLVDAGYVDSARIVESKEQYDVRLVGPLTEDSSWQARAGTGYAAGCFVVDWEARKVTCPQGQTSSIWTETHTGWGKDAIHVGFASATCESCQARVACTKTARGGRALTLKPRAQHIAMLARRAEQQSEEFKEEYQRRAGVEGTVSQGVRVGGMRQCRYLGAAKTRLQHILIAIALNLVRIVAWLEEQPRARTRVTTFAELARRQSRTRLVPAVAF